MLSEKLDNVIKTTRSLIIQHNLNGWIFSWDRSKRRYGCCHHNRKMITISYYLAALNPFEETLNVIRHEIAHALTPGHHHDYHWKAVARSIGCTGDRCYNETVIKPKSNYVLECPNCTKQYPRYRKTRKSYACTDCCRRHSYGKYDERFKLILKYA